MIRQGNHPCPKLVFIWAFTLLLASCDPARFIPDPVNPNLTKYTAEATHTASFGQWGNMVWEKGMLYLWM